VIARLVELVRFTVGVHVDFTTNDEHTVFLKTIIPSRKATKECFGEEPHED
jgi:hypothetical protein